MSDCSKPTSEQQQTPTQPSDQVVYCLNGCGFFGHASTQNYCSQCHKKLFTTTSSHSNNTSSSPDSKSVPSTPLVSPLPSPIISSSSSSSSSPAPTTSSSPSEFQTHFNLDSKTSSSSSSSDMAVDDTPASTSAAASAGVNSTEASSSAPADCDESGTPGAPSGSDKPIQKKKHRCYLCNKKVGIMGFECRCEYVFCASHRYPQSHQCTFDLKSLHQNQLKASNPAVKKSRFERIEDD